MLWTASWHYNIYFLYDFVFNLEMVFKAETRR
jgi:hypothetical protein